MNDTFYPVNDSTFSREKVAAGRALRAGRFWPLSANVQEAIYQVVIVFVLLVSFSFELDETQPQTWGTLFTLPKLAFFLNYLVAAMIINYVLLPAFYYRKRTMLFIMTLAALLTLVILIDEFVLEQIFFPDTRGTHFPGLLFTLVETLPIIIIIVAFKFAWDSNRRQGEVEHLKSLVKESELHFLKMQINPHFLFNNLNNLYSYAIDNSPKTPSIILELSAVLRHMLYDCREDVVLLDKELQHLKNFIALNKLHLENRGEVIYTEAIDGYRLFIPPLILMVFVENAFKHSMAGMSTGIRIDISVQVSADGVFKFRCMNNYAQRASIRDSSNGIGLENVRKRLDLQYAGKYSLDIEQSEDSFITILTMQLT